MKLFYLQAVSSVKGCDVFLCHKKENHIGNVSDAKINLVDPARDIRSPVLLPTASNNFLYSVLQGKLESAKLGVQLRQAVPIQIYELWTKYCPVFLSKNIPYSVNITSHFFLLLLLCLQI